MLFFKKLFQFQMDDFSKILIEKILKSQAVLSNWSTHRNPIPDKEALQQLNEILDNSVLSALKKSAKMNHSLLERLESPDEKNQH